MALGGREGGLGGLNRKEWRRLVSFYRVRSITAPAKSQMLNNLPLEAEARRKTLQGCFTGGRRCAPESGVTQINKHIARIHRV